MTQTAVLTPRPQLPDSPEPARSRPSRGSWLARHPAWPVTALLAGYPLWWALGLGDYIWILLAIPMAARLYAWSAAGNRKIRVPPGFGLWLLFMVVVVIGAAALSAKAPGTLTSPVSNRVISYGVRFVGYLGDTVLLLFVGNLTERELPRARLAWLLGLVALYTIAGGLLGALFSHLHFTSPLAAIVPNRLQAGNQILQAQLHPAFAQLQSVLGSSGRPDAPFAYTNIWGNCVALLLPWLIARWWFHGTRRQRLIALAGSVIAVVPIIYSLDRGLWLGLIFALVYIAVRLAATGRLAVLGGLIAALAIAGILIGATPLQSMITSRLANGASDSRRGSLSVTSVQDALASPIIGFGDTRHQQGSVQSVSVGRSAKCPTCGNGTIGGNGQLWLLFVANGFVGAALYLGFFAYGVARFWRDRSPYGLAGVLVLLLMFIFMISYTATGSPLGSLMLSYAMLWKNDRARRQGVATAEPGSRTVRSHPVSFRPAPGSPGPVRPGPVPPGPIPPASRLTRSRSTRSRSAPSRSAASRFAPSRFTRSRSTMSGSTMSGSTHVRFRPSPVSPRPVSVRGALGGAARRMPAEHRTHGTGHPAGRPARAPAPPGAGPDSGPAGPRLKDVARGSALNLVGALVAALTTLALTVVITREYSKPVAGAFFTAISLFLIVETVAGLGAWVGLVNFIARLRRLGHEDRVPAILRAAVVPVVVVSLACTAAMLLFAGPLAHVLLSGHLGKSGAAPGKVADALRALAVALPFAALADTLLGASRGYRQMRPTVIVDKFGRSGGQLIGVLIAISAGSVALLAPCGPCPTSRPPSAAGLAAAGPAPGAPGRRRGGQAAALGRRSGPRPGDASPGAGVACTARPPADSGGSPAPGRSPTWPRSRSSGSTSSSSPSCADRWKRRSTPPRPGSSSRASSPTPRSARRPSRGSPNSSRSTTGAGPTWSTGSPRPG